MLYHIFYYEIFEIHKIFKNNTANIYVSRQLIQESWNQNSIGFSYTQNPWDKTGAGECGPSIVTKGWGPRGWGIVWLCDDLKSLKGDEFKWPMQTRKRCSESKQKST